MLNTVPIVNNIENNYSDNNISLGNITQDTEIFSIKLDKSESDIFKYNEKININIHNDDIDHVILDNIAKNKINVYWIDNKFFIKDGEQTIGSFNVENIINNFASIQNASDRTFNMIRKYIGYIKLNKTRYPDVVIYDSSESPIMGNLEFIMRLNKQLFYYERTQLNNMFTSSRNIQQVKIFIYKLLCHTLKLLSDAINLIYYEHIGNGAEKDKHVLNSISDYEQLKECMLRYSINIMHRITLYVMDEIKIVNDKNAEINDIVNMSVKLKTILSNKIQNTTKAQEIKSPLSVYMEQIGGNTESSSPSNVSTMINVSEESTPEIIADNYSLIFNV